jgi:NADP-dependent 3-hydroxy acid dehydrogenase YdfG
MSTQVWFVTGSSRGLGRALVEELLAAGHNVIATARKTNDLQDLVAKYSDSRILTLPLDVTDRKAVFEVVAKAAEKWGRLDVVVNNAGYGFIASVEEFAIEDFKVNRLIICLRLYWRFIHNFPVSLTYL